MGRLAGRVAFITGAGAGIARAAAALFADQGAQVGLIEIDVQSGLAAEKALREQGRQALCVHADVTR